MSKDFFQAVEDRRSYYAVSKDVVASDERIIEIIEHAVKYVPSAFNSQSTRVIVLLGTEHDKFWELTTETLRKVVPEENFGATQEKMTMFGQAYGTVLFFEDEEVIAKLQEQFSLYADNFPVWSEQTSGMHQFAVWIGLEIEGYGASLQHYNPLVDSAVQKEWNVPASWKLRAQMPFGKPTAPAGEKQFNSIEERVKVYR
ncbi:nitroreductase family protein [Alkalicoccobacillus porphyridii]|uniref:Nitroreductase family protein n=1 Tax=Alkalicoccobacillus porphyridii TaxID=2597270 RepID=A0A553ZVG3_9BACI|nr:nitroreductase family protein [Alkalicoccobacillus porphyridii]TSB45470.1 nitroreductase family protein [Alkalicoccobacillus porphyridii]